MGMTDPSQELKPLPCPFCLKDTTHIRGNDLDGYWVMCCGCLARRGQAWMSRESAITAWNARAPSTDEALLQQALDALKGCSNNTIANLQLRFDTIAALEARLGKGGV